MRVCIFCVALLSIQSAQAFPPAPSFTIAGTVRNPFGWAITAESEAVVVVKQEGQKVAQALIGGDFKKPKGFEVRIPLDLRPQDAYVSVAHPPGVRYTLEVKMGNQIFPVTDLRVTDRLVASVGGRVNVDFSIAEDSDGDGLPDSWELYQLAEAGISNSDPLTSLDTLSRDGDFDQDGTSDYAEYIAGTFAFLATETLDLKIEEMSDWISFKTFLVVDKTYEVEATTDLKTWNAVPVKITGETKIRTKFTVDNTREVTLETERSGADDNRLFRLKVQ